MSNHATHAVWNERRAGRLPGRAVLAVALAMADWTNGNGEVYAGGRALADLTGYALSTVQQAVRDVVGSGLYREVVTGRGRRATTYRFAISPPVAKLGDGNGVATGDNVATPQGLLRVVTGPNGVATDSGTRSDRLRGAYKEDTNTDTRLATEDFRANMDALRGRLNGPRP